MKKTVLVVDDDSELLKLLTRYLSKHDLAVLNAYNGAEALAVIEQTRPDAIITDVEMPGMDGLTFCRRLRETGAAAGIPVIIMSGKKITEADQLSGYTGGADDYVLKPLSYPLLLAKVRALLRRSKEAPFMKAPTLKQPGFELNLEGRELLVSGRPVALTAKEFDLFSLLVSKPGRVLSINNLIETVWGFDPTNYNDPHTVEVHISNLRRKLGRKLSARIKAVPGHGYKFE